MSNFLLAALLAAATTQPVHDAHAGHSTRPPHASPATTELAEPGQSAFAAIQEIVARLTADPTTDWSRVNIEALRLHLIDMDNVMMRARIEASEIEGGARYRVTGPSEVFPSIQRMVRGHSQELESGWVVEQMATVDGAVISIADPTGRDKARIRGLGFAGMLTLDNHHQPHHYGIAAGTMRH